MEKLLIAAVLACQPGDRAIDLRDKIPREVQNIDLLVTVEPFYARFYIYQLGNPESMMQCCSNKRSSVIRISTGDGRFCVRQSQPRMKWYVRALLKPGVKI
jgi:hypothetical protein